MRVLIACEKCHRQIDVSAYSEGESLRCLCGSTLQVPHPTSHEAAVVRCSSCGAPRQDDAVECTFCGSDFTLHERDLDTICPHCLTRISRRARYCHHCAEPILPAEGGESTDRNCPACGEKGRLFSRRLGRDKLSVLECGACAGFFLDNETFRLLVERARHGSLPFPLAEARDGDVAPPFTGAATERFYRPCPWCTKLMSRRNYGARSGVIVDTCREHGIWLDGHELDRILAWIKSGGEETAARLRAEAELDEKRWREMKQRLDRGETDLEPSWTSPSPLIDWLGLLSRLLVGK
jgi:Zn-finger nucleic acid-binding protein